jgi:hypothetical protein
MEKGAVESAVQWKKGSSSRPSLARALYGAFGFQFILLGLFAFFEECFLRYFHEKLNKIRHNRFSSI